MRIEFLITPKIFSNAEFKDVSLPSGSLVKKSYLIGSFEKVTDCGSMRRWEVIVSNRSEDKGIILDPTMRFEIGRSQPEDVNKEIGIINKKTLND